MINTLLSNNVYQGEIIINDKFNMNDYFINNQVSYIRQDSTISIELLYNVLDYYSTKENINPYEEFSIKKAINASL